MEKFALMRHGFSSYSLKIYRTDLVVIGYMLQTLQENKPNNKIFHPGIHKWTVMYFRITCFMLAHTFNSNSEFLKMLNIAA